MSEIPEDLKRKAGDDMDMQARIERLERRGRLQAWALLALGSVGLLAGAYRGDIVQCRQLVITDEDGKDRIVLGATKTNAMVTCYDRKGDRRASLASDEPAGGIVQVWGPRDSGVALIAPSGREPLLQAVGSDGTVVFETPRLKRDR